MNRSIALFTFTALLTQGLPALAQFSTPAPLPPATPTIVDPLLPLPNGIPNPYRSPRPAPTKPQGPFNLNDRLNELRTASTSLRYEIIQQMSEPDRNIVPALIAALKTESDPLVKSAIAEVLAKRWEEATPAIEPLIAMLTDKRRALVPTDDYFRGPKPLPLSAPLAYLPVSTPVKRISSEPPGNPTNLLRISAIEVLGKIGLPAREKATRSLTALLKDENSLVQINAVWALLEIGADVPVLDTWLSALQNGNAESRQAAARLAQGNNSLLRKAFGSEATPKTITLLTNALGAPENSVRSAAREGLKLFGTEVVPDLTKALNSPNPLLRLTAAKLLGKQRDKAFQATTALINLLGDNGEYNPPPAPYGMIDYIPFESDDYYDDYWTGKPSSSDRFVRINAAIALGSIGSSEAVPALQQGLKDPNPQMQLACAWALTRLGQVETVLPALDTLIKNPQQDIQFTSLRILKAIGMPGAKYLLPIFLKQFDEAKPEKRENVVLGFLDFGVVALPALSRLRETLEGPDVNARGYAVTILANIYEDVARKDKKGELSKDDRRLATKELEKILKIITKPDAKFNKAPVDRLRTVQTKL